MKYDASILKYHFPYMVLLNMKNFGHHELL